MRIYELAKELGASSKDLMDIAHKVGADAKNHFCTLTEREIEEVKSILAGNQEAGADQDGAAESGASESGPRSGSPPAFQPPMPQPISQPWCCSMSRHPMSMITDLLSHSTRRYSAGAINDSQFYCRDVNPTFIDRRIVGCPHESIH